MAHEFGIGYTPPTLEEEYGAGKQQVANMLDEPKWSWLKARLIDQPCTWPQIMQIVADNI